MFKSSYPLYIKTAKEWTQRYAQGGDQVQVEVSENMKETREIEEEGKSKGKHQDTPKDIPLPMKDSSNKTSPQKPIDNSLTSTIPTKRPAEEKKLSKLAKLRKK